MASSYTANALDVYKRQDEPCAERLWIKGRTAADAYLRESFSAGEQYFDSFCQYICEKTEMI